VDRADLLDHDLFNRSFHQVVIMRKDGAGSEDEVLQEIELGYDANEMMIFYHGESVEIMGLKQMFEFPQTELTRDRQGELGHYVLGLHA
jgi:hypothetical protein